MFSPNSRLIALAGIASFWMMMSGVTYASGCSSGNGCVGYKEGMRVFSTDPTVAGVIEFNEAFIDLGTKTYNGKACQRGVIRVGRNTNRVGDPSAVRNTAEKIGMSGGHPIQACAP